MPIERLRRNTYSTATSADILRVVAARPLSTRQIAWRLQAPLALVSARVEKMLASGKLVRYRQRRTAAGNLVETYRPA